jgi:hypothetical protein
VVQVPLVKVLVAQALQETQLVVLDHLVVRVVEAVAVTADQ